MMSAPPPAPTTGNPADFVSYHDGLLPTDKPEVRFRILGHVPTNRIFVELWHGPSRLVESFPSVAPSRPPDEHQEGILPADAERAFVLARALQRNALYGTPA